MEYIVNLSKRFDAWSEDPSVNIHTRTLVVLLVLVGIITPWLLLVAGIISLLFGGIVGLFFWLGPFAIRVIILTAFGICAYVGLHNCLKESDEKKRSRQ